MTRIKDSSVDAVKAAAEILPLVEDYVRLRKAGGTYKGLCPFHQERTPSFTVTPARGTFKCFGCGEGGDAIAFVEKIENVDFVGAIEFLARRFGLELEYEEISPEADRERRRRERLQTLLERATVFYERVLWESEHGAFAREYLASRGLGEEVCRQFRLGFAPGGALLARRALQEGYERDDLLAAGLGNRRGNDYFQRRLVFPLADARGRVRGFQARKLHDDDPLQAKYVNSPESELFHKGELLYGLDTGRQAIAKEDRAVVVEGNTDVLALRQAGFQPVVASMGTALTEAQLRELARLTRRLYLCFDADAAGQDATLRGMELAVKQGFAVHVVPLPKGTDPADDPAAFERQLASPVSYQVHMVRLLHARAADRRSSYAAIKAFLGTQPDSPERLDAIRLAADLLDLPPETQAGLAPPRTGARTAGVISPRLLDAGQRLERAAL
ncbi:MAG TPA: DNA primase, partial [Gaiellaceae bacterium]|nr:DNA primase [Gaiellaceae bacterium]